MQRLEDCFGTNVFKLSTVHQRESSTAKGKYRVPDQLKDWLNVEFDVVVNTPGCIDAAFPLNFRCIYHRSFPFDSICKLQNCKNDRKEHEHEPGDPTACRPGNIVIACRYCSRPRIEKSWNQTCGHHRDSSRDECRDDEAILTGITLISRHRNLQIRHE
ncbi:MAG: hypothetical protein AAGD11_06230, partial [Planctomycetota bacterium]